MPEQSVQEVRQIATLPFGVGLVGQDRHLQGERKQLYVSSLARYQRPIPKGLILAADCMDDRPTVRLADGTTDPAQLAMRRAASLPGGTVLATMKAGIAANAAFLRGAKSSKEAYEITYRVLEGLGYQDAAHEGCGASTFVQASTAQRLVVPVLTQTFAALGGQEDVVRGPLSKIERNVGRCVEDGFYQDWSPEWHADLVTSRKPGNFSFLQTDHTPTHGHNASGVLSVADGHYFAKNEFISATDGLEAFALTFGYADEIADQIGGSDEERELLKYAFRDDAFNVSNQIVSAGLEVYA